MEDDLSSVGIAGPLVENQHSRKISQIVHLADQRVWETIESHGSAQIANVARAKLRTCLTSLAHLLERYTKCAREAYQFIIHILARSARRGKSQKACKKRSE